MPGERSHHAEGFDPDAPADLGLGVFGLPPRDDARIRLIPVPYEATTSYRQGAGDGPSAILDASAQVDLTDRRFGEPWRLGIVMEPQDPRTRRWSAEAAALARPIIERGGATPDDAGAVARVDALAELLESWAHARASSVLSAGAVPGVVGGDHSVPLGAIRACAERFPGLGVLHIDAHLDLRDTYEGFAQSHASIMHNVLGRVPSVARLCSVGIRDFGRAEAELAASDERVRVWYDDDLFDQLSAPATDLRARAFTSIAQEVVACLPEHVYISFDIDGLDPSLCPSTGTPVPGGLSFREASALLACVARMGRRVVGFDLVEVAPGTPWDADVGARLLYRLCGAAAASMR